MNRGVPQKYIWRRRIALVALVAFLIVVAFVVALIVSPKEKKPAGTSVPEQGQQPDDIENPQSEKAPVATNSLLTDADLDVKTISTEQDVSKNVIPSRKAKAAEAVQSIQKDWRLLLVNFKNPLPTDFTVETVDVGGYPVDKRIEGPLKQMILQAKANGINLQIVSGYRTVDTQKTNYNKKIAEYRSSGYSQEKAKEYTDRYFAQPGFSEHHTGLAVDLLTPSYKTLTKGYSDTAAAKWLKSNAADYGFILRYLDGKDSITGITFEPWHYRYVGVEVATEIMQKGYTLEEYLYIQEKAVRVIEEDSSEESVT